MSDCFYIAFGLSGSEEDLFYDAPSSPVGETQFFSDVPGSLQRVDSVKRRGLVKKDPQKNMTELLLRFEINEVWRNISKFIQLKPSSPESHKRYCSQPLAQCSGCLLCVACPFPCVQVSVQVCRLSRSEEITVLHLDIESLGTELKLRSFDMNSCTFLQEICLKCPEYMGLYRLGATLNAVYILYMSLMSFVLLTSLLSIYVIFNMLFCYYYLIFIYY